jgi:O-acetyl-ADP-ribose deacetylase (regulator of RNase III)
LSEEARETFASGRVVVLTGDLTGQRVDVIVNAANSTLLGGAGVDGAIHRAGGPRILEECREIRRTNFPEGLPTGEAVLTGGGELAARYVIHTVGPIYGRHHGLEAELLKRCYQNSLRLAAEHGLASIAFPAISTGALGYPREEAARVSSAAINEFLLDQESTPAEIRLVFFRARDAQVFVQNQRFDELRGQGSEVTGR